jgi:hypothetical protein
VRLILGAAHNWTRVQVEQDPGQNQTHESIVAICDVVDRLRKHSTEQEIPNREVYESARTIGQAIQKLEEQGWLLEMEQEEEEVHGETYDGVIYWIVRIRPQRVRPSSRPRSRALR